MAVHLQCVSRHCGVTVIHVSLYSPGTCHSVQGTGMGCGKWAPDQRSAQRERTTANVPGLVFFSVWMTSQKTAARCSEDWKVGQPSCFSILPQRIVLGQVKGPPCVLASRRRRAAELTATELCRAAPSASAVTSATSLRCLRTLPSPPACSIRRNAAGPEHEATRAVCCLGLAGKG